MDGGRPSSSLAGREPRARPGLAPAMRPGTLLIAGATGALGHELVRRLAGRHRFDHTLVLAREPIRDGLQGVETVLAPETPIAQWPPVKADTALVLFEPPRLYYDRERALWTPEPAQLPALAALAARMRRAGPWPSCSRMRKGVCRKR